MLSANLDASGGESFIDLQMLIVNSKNQGTSLAKLKQSWIAHHILRYVDHQLINAITFSPLVVFQNLIILQRTRVVQQPSHLTIKQGEEASLQCVFSTDPELSPSLDIHWLLGEERLEGDQEGQVTTCPWLTLFPGKSVESERGRPVLLCW